MLQRLAIFASGGGTTAAEILRACEKDGSLHGLIDPVCLIVNKPNIGAIAKWAAAGKNPDSVYLVRRKNYATLEAFGESILEALRKEKVDLVSQNGWTTLTPSNVVEEFEGQIVNQHPGPLDPVEPRFRDQYPDFGGKGMIGLVVHEAVIRYYRLLGDPVIERWTEGTSHEVKPDNAYDTGNILAATGRIQILESDTAETLQARVLPEEHKLAVRALRLLATGAAMPLTRHPHDHLARNAREAALLKQAKAEAIAHFQQLTHG